MSAVCSDGGRITGPHLKEMSRLTHTEYVPARAQSPRPARHPARDDVRADRDRLADAERVHRHHPPRAHAARLLLGGGGLFTPRPSAAGAVVADEPTHDLDAPILIRTAYLVDGRLRVPVGATLVRHSDPYGEVNETHGKAAGVLGAIGAIPRDTVVPIADAIDEDAPTAEPKRLADDPGSLPPQLPQCAPRPVLAESAGCRRCGPIRGPVGDRGRCRGPLHHDARASAAPPRALGRDRALERRDRQPAR